MRVKRHIWTPHLKKWGQLTPGPRGSATPVYTVECLCSIAVCLCFPLFYNVHICVCSVWQESAVAQWLRWWTFTQWVCVQFPLVVIWVISGGRKDIWLKLFPCVRKSPTLVPRYLGSTSKPWNKGVNDVKFGHLDVFCCYWSKLIRHFNFNVVF